MTTESTPREVGSNAGLGAGAPAEEALRRAYYYTEAAPDWYARGQDWGLADALTNGQSGDWVLDDIARAFAAGAEAKTTMKVEISMDPELVRRVVQAETEVALLRTALPVVQDASAIPIAWASSVGWRANQLISSWPQTQMPPTPALPVDASPVMADPLT